MAARRRLDAELVRRSLVPSRAVAQALVAEYRVLVNGAAADKVSRMVDAGDAIEIVGPPRRFVGRGGEKLEGALTSFAVDPAGFRCLDAGASTGGFTDCLLQHGADHVIAVDVGYGQLHESVAASPRVTNLERTNIRSLGPGDIGGTVDLVVGDLSFISLRTVMEALVSLLRPDGHLVLLVKPQFEAGRQEAAKGKGVIRDRAIWHRVLSEVIACAAALGAALEGAAVSPIRGGDGNVEFLVHLRVRGGDGILLDLDALVDSVDP